MFRIKKVDVSYYNRRGAVMGIRSVTIDLDFKTIADCRKVIEIAEIKNWEILDTIKDFWSGEMVEQSKELHEAKNSMADERAKDQQEKMEKVVRINALPKKFNPVLSGIPDGLEFWFERSEAEFTPARSFKIIGGGLDCKFRIGKEVKDLSFWNYESQDGKLLVKSFCKDDWRFGPLAKQMNCERLLRELSQQRKVFAEAISKA